jgi:hypothetical protein
MVLASLTAPVGCEPFVDFGAPEPYKASDLVVRNTVLGDESADVAHSDVQPSGQLGDVKKVVGELSRVGHWVLLVKVRSCV